MEIVATVTSVIVLEYFIFVMMVGAARGKTGIAAPAMTGDPRLERVLRVQMNTLEQLVIVLSSMWLFAHTVNPLIAAGAGLVFVIGRAIYCRGYLKDPGKRGLGFMIGFLATAVLLLGSLYGTVSALVQ